MYLADYHTHTQFSPDAHDPMTVMAQAALDAGMDEICFTDHVEPLTWGSNELRPPYDWSGLTADFANVQAALGDRIHLRLGMEMGDAQKAPAHMKKLLEDAPQFDFIIGSVHLLSERFGSEDPLHAQGSGGGSDRIGRLSGRGFSAGKAGRLYGSGPPDPAPAVFQ